MIDPTLRNVCKVLQLAMEVSRQIMTTAIESDTRVNEFERGQLENLRRSIDITDDLLAEILL